MSAGHPLPGATDEAASPLDSVQTLSRMIKELEGQLDRVLAINDALERDLDAERERRREAERTIRARDDQLQRAEREASTVEDKKAEIDHLEAERARLSDAVSEFGRQLDAAEQENRKQARLAEQLRAGRDDALEDLKAVEGQFERAMEMVGDLKTRLGALGEERNALARRNKMLEEKLQRVEEARDALLAETEESRRALEEIRRSLSDAYLRRSDDSH